MAEKGAGQPTTSTPQPVRKVVVPSPDHQRGYTPPKPAPKTGTTVKK